ncbi:hypothetical protein [Burkholderia sp. GbtcB21]|nr:hypothetical protein [Burkholderia sp. GbtcB21]
MGVRATAGRHPAWHPAEHKTIDVTIPLPESSVSRYLRVYFRKNGIGWAT